MEKSIINVEDVRFSYITAEGVAPIVLDGVTLDIEEGSFVAVLGHNGSGKSTLAKHMNAILLPTGGKVYVDGMDTADEDKLLDIRRTVGMVFQNPDNQIVANVVEEDVAFAPENLGVPPEEIRRRVDDALKAVGMYQYREHAPHLLSGGQKQRIAIAGVIAMEPRCIVLDEPTAMLDPIGRADVLRTIKTLNRERGVTVVLITHHMDEAAQADRLVVMAKGRVVADGAPKEVFQDVEGLKSVGLTVPDTTELLWELRREGLDVPLDALSDEECAQALKELLCRVKSKEWRYCVRRSRTISNHSPAANTISSLSTLNSSLSNGRDPKRACTTLKQRTEHNGWKQYWRQKNSPIFTAPGPPLSGPPWRTWTLPPTPGSTWASSATPARASPP